MPGMTLAANSFAASSAVTPAFLASRLAWPRSARLQAPNTVPRASSLSIAVLSLRGAPSFGTKQGFCGSDFSEISRLAAELNRVETIARLRKLCEQWIYSTCLCFALPNVDRERSGFAYQYSVFQLELSRNLLFW